jgi:hypothetical protein
MRTWQALDHWAAVLALCYLLNPHSDALKELLLSPTFSDKALGGFVPCPRLHSGSLGFDARAA